MKTKKKISNDLKFVNSSNFKYLFEALHQTFIYNFLWKTKHFHTHLLTFPVLLCPKAEDESSSYDPIHHLLEIRIPKV